MEGIWLMAFLVQWVLMVFLGLLVIGILRQLNVMQQRWNMAAPPITALEIGDELPPVTLPDLHGSAVAVNARLRHRGGALLFLSADCSSCRMLLERLSRLEQRERNHGQDRDGQKEVVLVVMGDQAKARRLLDEFPHLAEQACVVFDADGVMSRRLAIVAVPTGIAVDEDGRVVSQTFNPHAGQWLSQALRVDIPAQDAHTLVGMVVPAVYAQHRSQE